MSKVTFQRRKGRNTVAGKKPFTKIYSSAANSEAGLFVPTADMLRVHEASKPDQVAIRAGVSKEIVGIWRRQKPELFKWFYNQSRSNRNPPNGERLTDQMKKFAAEATIEAIARATLRPNRNGQRKRFNQYVSVPVIYSWLDKYEKHSWFRGWLVCGEDPPKGMAVPTENEIQRCDAAWDYIGICAEVGINPNRTHRAWIEKRAISSADWLLWLFAVKVPAGKFVVNDSLKRLREERSIDAFCRAAKIHRNSHLNWTSNPNTKAALEAAIRTFTGAGNRNALPDPKEFEGLQARTRAAMKKYALATALKTCIERAGFREQYFNETFREAKRLKLDESITNFLDWKKPFHLPWYESGEVSLNFFVPTNDMIRFQKTACKRWQSGKLWDLRNRLPHFDQWFQDVALGRQFQGERLGFHHHRNGTKEGLDQNAIGSQILQVDKLVVNAHKAEVHSGHKMKRRNIRKAKPSLPVSMPTIGRPKGTTDVGAWKRRKAILADHKSGKFPTIVELAAHYSISRGRASNIIHGRR